MTTATLPPALPRNPRNPRSYSVTEAPPSGTDASRYAIFVTPEGWSTSSRAAGVSAAYRELLVQRLATATPVQPEPKTVELKYVGKSAETGEWVIVPRGSISRVPTLEATRSGRFTSTKKKRGGQLLDEAFRNEGHGAHARDDVLYDALRDLLAAENADPPTARELNNSVALLLLARAGIGDVRPEELVGFANSSAALGGRPAR